MPFQNKAAAASLPPSRGTYTLVFLFTTSCAFPRGEVLFILEYNSFIRTNKQKEKKKGKKFLQNYKYVVYEFKYLTLGMTQAFPWTVSIPYVVGFIYFLGNILNINLANHF